MSIRSASFALVSCLALATPTIASANATPTVAQVERTTTTAPAPAPKSDAASYAEREAQDKQVADYEGGSVVIAMSGTAFVLLLFLLILI